MKTNLVFPVLYKSIFMLYLKILSWIETEGYLHFVEKILINTKISFIHNLFINLKGTLRFTKIFLIMLSIGTFYTIPIITGTNLGKNV